MNYIKLLLTLYIMLFLGACSKIPQTYPRTSSHALKSYKSTDIGRVIEKQVAQHPGKSGFDIIRYGREAFTARIAMTDLTDKTLDLQYYLWDKDKTGRLLAYYTLKAADRGVKVRILLDDIGLEGRDSMIASMNAHPNIDIRIFNPFSNRSSHALNFLNDFNRVNHRMHNKTAIIDNSMAVVGGRNIGDHYFGVSNELNFRDMDVIAIGPVVRDVSKMYDYFWNGEWAVPLSVLVDKKYTLEDLKKARKELDEQLKKDNYPYPLEKDSKKFIAELKARFNDLVWSNAKMVWNDPAQMKLETDKQTDTMVKKLYRHLKVVNKSLYIESPYFIPKEKAIATLSALSKKGVKVRVLTNSLKSNDVLAAYAGYEPSRIELLKNGIEIYELRADAAEHKIINKTPVKGMKNSGLHAKVMLFDLKDVFIGSFNLDPRSATINTEGGLYIHSQKLAKRVEGYMNEVLKPENSYRLSLDKNGHIIWITEENGEEVIYRSDPKANAWDKFKVNLLQLLPLDEQL